MTKHYEHPSKVSRLEEGRFVVLDDAEHADCTCRFFFEEDGEERWEGLLARRLTTDRARVCGIPVFVYDVNLADEVSVIEADEGALVVTEIFRDAGNFSFRVYFPNEPADDADERMRGLMVELESFDCWFDVWSPFLVALSASPEHSQIVADYLLERERRSELEYEAGRSRQPS